jgi:predicted phosphoribosyltransferase
MDELRFIDRRHGGRALAESLRAYADRDDVLVLGLPRGGVVVAYEVAAALNAPLDAFLVRKLGVPGYPELAMGAIASGGVRVMNDEVIRWYQISTDAIELVARLEALELQRRERAYRGDRSPIPIDGKVAILVDDGLATGFTMRAAVAAVRQHHPLRTIVAVPVGARDTCAELASIADETHCLRAPHGFRAVGEWYEDFSETSDDEVRALLRSAKSPRPAT